MAAGGHDHESVDREWAEDAHDGLFAVEGEEPGQVP
jgi:hypothetical protein